MFVCDIEYYLVGLSHSVCSALLEPSYNTTSGDEDRIAMATGLVGSVGAFVPETETISAYVERLQLYLIANDIKDKKKVSVLLMVIGPKVLVKEPPGTYPTTREDICQVSGEVERAL